ncbi:MAG: hypothetical protein OEO20_15785 [Gemmatimonadota bacterium]|nr:hypothetical protein [Gemmatimonadota bacterium]MDH3479758.1 hypothetical protein [Gemmatimonadota bacterium]MDH3570162.1 hypothetical protein [Gemmatimonadota bacterium]MDH5551412.1 hypothetical protein [Gemmatimonadota bacterium]
MRSAVLPVILVLASFTDAVAQELPLQPGQRVRVTVPRLAVNKHEETFQALRGGTLVLAAISYPLVDVTRLDVHRGHKSWGWVNGAVLGFLAGVGVGATAGALVDCGVGSSDDDSCVGFGIVVGAPIGLLVGTTAGLLIKTDKWEEVPLDRLRVSVVPTPNGFAIGARLAF